MRRVLAPILACLALASPAAAQVGDEQYSDPLAQPDQTQEEIPGVAGEDQPTLSDQPVGSSPPVSSGSGPSSGTAPATSSGASAPSASPARLPNTGADARVLAALGAALLLVGIGLRLRTADGSF